MSMGVGTAGGVPADRPRYRRWPWVLIMVCCSVGAVVAVLVGFLVPEHSSDAAEGEPSVRVAGDYVDPCTVVPAEVLAEVVPEAAPVHLPLVDGGYCRWSSVSSEQEDLVQRQVSVALREAPDGVAQALQDRRRELRGAEIADEPAWGAESFSAFIAGEEMPESMRSVQWASRSQASVLLGHTDVLIEIGVHGWEKNSEDLDGSRDGSEKQELLPIAREAADSLYDVSGRAVVAEEDPDQFSITERPENMCALVSDDTVDRLLAPNGEDVAEEPEVEDQRGSCEIEGSFDRHERLDDAESRILRIELHQRADATEATQDTARTVSSLLDEQLDEVSVSHDLPERGDQAILVAGTSTFRQSVNGVSGVAHLVVRHGDALVHAEYRGTVHTGNPLAADPMPLAEAEEDLVDVVDEVLEQL